MKKINIPENKKKPLIITLIIVNCLLLLAIIAGINKPHFSPFSSSLKVNTPTSLHFSEEGSVAVDNQNKRMLIYNPDNELTSIVDTTVSGSPVERIQKVVIADGSIYAIGTTHFNKGVYLSSESVVRYGLDGKYKETILSKTYTENDFVNNTTYKGLSYHNGYVYVCEVNGNKANLIKIDNNKDSSIVGSWSFDESINSIEYSPKHNKLGIISSTKNCYAIDLNTNEITQMNLEEFVTKVLSKTKIDVSKLSIDAIKTYPTVIYDENGNISNVIIVDSITGKMSVFDNNGNIVDERAETSYSLGLYVSNLLYYIGLVFIGIEIVILIIYAIVNKRNKRSITVVLIIGGIIITSFFYNGQINKTREDEFNNHLITQTKQLSYAMSLSMGKAYEQSEFKDIQAFCSDKNNQEVINSAYSVLKKMCDANGVEESIFVTTYLYDDKGNLYTYVDSKNNIIAGQNAKLPDDVNAMLETESEHKVITSNIANETLVYDYDFVYGPSGEIIGVVCVAAYRGNIDYINAQSSINLAVSLIAIFIGIYISLSVIKTFKGDISRRKKRDKNDIANRTVDLAGLVSFSYNIVTSIDSAIIVYVAQSLCEGLDPTRQAILVAMPIAATQAGKVLGTLFSDTLCRKFGERIVTIVASSLALIATLFCMMAVFNKNIFLYIVAKFVIGALLGGIVYVQFDTIPYRANDESSKKKAMESLMQGNTAATIISMLIGGYIAQYLSYSSVYFVGALLTLSIVVMSYIAFKGCKKHESNDSRKEQAKESLAHWTVFLKEPMLMYLVFYLVPTMLINGYKSFLFPLYSAGAGISVLLLSNLSVFVKTVTYVTNDFFSNLCKRFSDEIMILIPRLITCVGLICFFVSSNIYWAIAMMFIFDITAKLPRVPQKMYLSEIAEEYNLDPKRVQSNYYTIESSVFVFQSPALSMIVSFGVDLACGITGIISGALYGVFGIFNRKRISKKK